MTVLVSMICNTRPSASGGMLDGLAIMERTAFFPVGDHLKGGSESNRKQVVAKRVGGLTGDVAPKRSTEWRSPRIQSTVARWGVSRSSAFLIPQFQSSTHVDGIKPGG